MDIHSSFEPLIVEAEDLFQQFQPAPGAAGLLNQGFEQLNSLGVRHSDAPRRRASWPTKSTTSSRKLAAAGPCSRSAPARRSTTRTPATTSRGLNGLGM